MYSQKTQSEKISDAYFLKNEIKLNVIYPFWGMGEISYERNLTEHSSIGTSAFLDFKNARKSFFISPYYRYYLGTKPNAGFYLEGQTIFAKSDAANLFSVESEKNKTLFGIGFGTGYKLVFKNNWLLDANVAYGTFINASKNNSSDYFRAGLSLGKKF